MKKIKLAYLIDDDHISNFLTSRIFENAGFSEHLQIFPRANLALEALKMAKENNNPMPEIILFDLNMPGMDGWEFIEYFSTISIQPPIPAFVFTSSIDPSDREKSGQYPAILDVITKPLTTPKVERILQMSFKRSAS